VIPPEERRHLDVGSRPGEQPGGVGTVTVAIRCRGDAGEVAERTRAVLRAVLAHAGPPWPSLAEWRRLLPVWFIEASAPERSAEESERWLAWWHSLPPVERGEATRARRWTLANWLYWLEPSERQWFWWDAAVESPDALRVTVEVSGWPAPLGALEWLFRAAGAVEVTLEEPSRA
jgi:hypothetical protein